MRREATLDRIRLVGREFVVIIYSYSFFIFVCTERFASESQKYQTVFN